jgi:FAD dependent oxidoreductase
MSARADVAVVGAGIVGLATAYALTEKGASVAVYERGVPGNAQSGGESRIFRHAHDDRRLVELAREARGLWREWEERFGTELLSRDGVLGLGPAAERKLETMRSAGVRAHLIPGAEVAEHLPLLAGWLGRAVFDEDGGAIRTRASIEALTTALEANLVFDEVLSERSRFAPGAPAPSTRAWCSAPGAARPHWLAAPGCRCRSARPLTSASPTACTPNLRTGWLACSTRAMHSARSAPTRIRSRATPPTPWASRTRPCTRTAA